MYYIHIQYTLYVFTVYILAMLRWTRMGKCALSIYSPPIVLGDDQKSNILFLFIRVHCTTQCYVPSDSIQASPYTIITSGIS